MTNWHDLRLGLRGLGRRPVYSAIAIVTLALGLAASSTAFTFINTFYQRIPGAGAGDRLVSVLFVDEKGGESNGVSYPDYLDYAAESGTLSGLAGVVVLVAGTLRTPDEDVTTWVWGRAVTANFFSVLGVEMSVGRSISADGDQPDSVPQCVLAHHFWRRRFAADPAIVGRTVSIDRQTFLVVGVASPQYRTLFEGFHPDLWISLGGLQTLDPDYRRRMRER